MTREEVPPTTSVDRRSCRGWDAARHDGLRVVRAREVSSGRWGWYVLQVDQASVTRFCADIAQAESAIDLSRYGKVWLAGAERPDEVTLLKWRDEGERR